MKQLLVCLSAILLSGVLFSGKAFAGSAAVKAPRTADFIIVDSWLTGCFSGFFTAKEKRFQAAWKTAGRSAANDAKIWGGLFISDTNQTAGRRFAEVLSRFTYQAPQTAGGFLISQYYNTMLCKVNKVEYGCGATVLNMRVAWPGVTLGSYILARKTIAADPDNKLFQHEYGHYLQSKRMGLAYFVRVGLPAILSKGDHDTHPVEIDCNREGFLYFNRYFQQFRNDAVLDDRKGWNFDYNPFPKGVGITKPYRDTVIQYVDYRDSMQVNQLATLKVKPTFIDYASWILVPAPLIVGCVHAKHYNQEKLKNEGTNAH